MSLSKMTEIELYDVEEYKVYKFPVSQENYSEIIAGDLELASNLLNEQKLKNNYLAAFQFMKEASNVVSEKPLNMSAPSTSGLSLENENNEREDPAGELTAERMNDNGDQGNSGKMWTTNSKKFFIELCKRHDKDLESGIKKILWTKIANEMSRTFKLKFTMQQVDTKFKGLKNMYKKVKKHNDQSGDSKKEWEFYDLMDGIMFSKPEICARATCSSISSLTINSTPNSTGTSGKENINPTDEGDDDAGSSPQFVSAFATKRKHLESQANKRHKDKMQRQDRYLDLLERLTTAVERSARNE